MPSLASTATSSPILTPFLPHGPSLLAVLAGIVAGLWLACTVLTAVAVALFGLLVTSIRELIAARGQQARPGGCAGKHTQQRTLEAGEPSCSSIWVSPTHQPPQRNSAAAALLTHPRPQDRPVLPWTAGHSSRMFVSLSRVASPECRL